MGLDMYLYANRFFAPDSDEAKNVLAAVGISLADLRTMAKNDPMEAETYLYLSRWDYQKNRERQRCQYVVDEAGLSMLTTPESCGTHVEWDEARRAVKVAVPCIYWRKANAVHGWFVTNCQNGVDECQETPVSAEQLAKLRAACTEALAAYDAGNVDECLRLIPPVPGFFFGAYDIDEWYADNLRHTISEIERVVKVPASLRGTVEFSYRSSW